MKAQKIDVVELVWGIVFLLPVLVVLASLFYSIFLLICRYGHRLI